MKKLLLVATVAMLSATAVHAQLPDLKSATEGISGIAGAGKLISQFSSAIKPASFLSSWTTGKAGWLGSVGKISSAVDMAKSIASLAGFLKPGAFKSGFNVQNLIQTANTATTVNSAASVLKNLEGGLKPESLTDTWATQRPAWTSALDLIK